MDSVNDTAPARINFLAVPVFRSTVLPASPRSQLASIAVLGLAWTAMKRRLVVLGALAFGGLAITTSAVEAELENQIFTSKTHRVRIVVPRYWRATDQPSYPGMLLWMLRGQPEGKMVLTSEPFTREVYCSWPPRCRASSDPLPAKFACALREQLERQRLHVGPVQAGPKENEQAQMPSVWFEIDDGKRFLRQAVAVGESQLVSLTLMADSAEARNAHVRAFETALRTLRPLTAEELGTSQTSQEQDGSDGGAAAAPKHTPVGPCSE